MHQRNLISRNRIGALAASAVLLAACSNAGTATTTPTTAATQPPASTAATAPPSAGASQGAAAYEVELGDSAALGKFLTGEDGKTLYLFTPDTTSASNCNGACAATWPPFTLDGGETVKGGAGVTGTFSTITRQDGSKQVTYAGHPLYYYGPDAAAGDTNGQGLFDKWYVVGGDGKAITAKPQASGGRKY